MGVFSLRLLVKAMLCHPNKLRMNQIHGFIRKPFGLNISSINNNIQP